MRGKVLGSGMESGVSSMAGRCELVATVMAVTAKTVVALIVLTRRVHLLRCFGDVDGVAARRRKEEAAEWRRRNREGFCILTQILKMILAAWEELCSRIEGVVVIA